MSEELDVTDIPPGTVLMNKYRVVATLGVGGMGVVVAADHLALEKRVAMKFMLPNLVANKQVVQRFLNEARAATKISSEHVAGVLDVGKMTGPDLPSQGIPYMVMEYLKGSDLSGYVHAGKRFAVAEAIDYTVQAAEALAQAHRVNIIHRDIKPANLFLAEDDEGHKKVKVLDFGISKIVEEEPQEMGLTKTTTVLGSGLYMSPEQMRSAKTVDFRTDIYSLGVCLYELLTGTQPFTAESFSELCVKVNIDQPTPIQKWRPDISDELAAVIAKAYARSVDDRYQTVQELCAALAPYASAPSIGTIHHVQGITASDAALLRSSQPPPPMVPPSSAPLPLAQQAHTAGAVTATTEATPAKGSSIGTAVGIAIAALVVAGAAGVYLMQAPSGVAGGDAPSPVPTSSLAGGASTTAGGAPSVTPASTGAGYTASRDTASDGNIGSGSESDSTTAASAAPSAAKTGRPPVKPPVKPTATGTPTAPPPKTAKPMNRKCGIPDENGLMIPCDLAPP